MSRQDWIRIGYLISLSAKPMFKMNKRIYPVRNIVDISLPVENCPSVWTRYSHWTLEWRREPEVKARVGHIRRCQGRKINGVPTRGHAVVTYQAQALLATQDASLPAYVFVVLAVSMVIYNRKGKSKTRWPPWQ